MFYKRWIVIAVAALLLFGLISAISGAGQRDAWMQGYMAGRLSTGSDGAAALAPYMMPGGAFGPHYGGLGPGLFLGLGFLALGLFLVGRRFHGGGWAGKSDEWHEQMRQEAERWRQRHHSTRGARPWEGRPDSPDQDRMV